MGLDWNEWRNSQVFALSHVCVITTIGTECCCVGGYVYVHKQMSMNMKHLPDPVVDRVRIESVLDLGLSILFLEHG